MRSIFTIKYEASVAYTSLCCKITAQRSVLILDSNEILGTTAHCDDRLLPFNCAVFSHGYFLQSIYEGLHIIFGQIINF